MTVELNLEEQRVLGCLLDKAVITPDQYPLTLNALVNACNQKSSRDPVMTMSSGDVLHTLWSLQDKHLVRSDENFKTRVEKYTHRFCNTPFSDYQLDPAEYSVVTVLLLRGPRTPGELRANSGRLHTFDDNSEVVAALERLLVIENGPLVVQLPRTPGRKDAEYAHLLGGPVAVSEAAARPPEPRREAGPSLASRVEQLENEVAELRELVAGLAAQRDT